MASLSEYELPFKPPPIWELMEIEVEEIGERYAKLVMPFQEKLTQPFGILHGGAIFTLADSAAAVAIAPEAKGTRLLTIEMKINYLGPVAGGITEAHARVLRMGRVVPVDIEVINRGELVAKAIATYIIKA